MGSVLLAHPPLAPEAEAKGETEEEEQVHVHKRSYSVNEARRHFAAAVHDELVHEFRVFEVEGKLYDRSVNTRKSSRLKDKAPVDYTLTRKRTTQTTTPRTMFP